MTYAEFGRRAFVAVGCFAGAFLSPWLAVTTLAGMALLAFAVYLLRDDDTPAPLDGDGDFVLGANTAGVFLGGVLAAAGVFLLSQNLSLTLNGAGQAFGLAFGLAALLGGLWNLGYWSKPRVWFDDERILATNAFTSGQREVRWSEVRRVYFDPFRVNVTDRTASGELRLPYTAAGLKTFAEKLAEHTPLAADRVHRVFA